jgi:hypothetical protein
LEAEVKEEKERRKHSMQYWDKAQELAERHKQEKEEEELNREIAAEKRRMLLKYKADELSKQTAEKRKAKRDESQAEVHYICI